MDQADVVMDQADVVMASDDMDQADVVMASGDMDQADVVMASGDMDQADVVMASGNMDQADVVMASGDMDQADVVMASGDMDQADVVRASGDMDQADVVVALGVRSFTVPSQGVMIPSSSSGAKAGRQFIHCAITGSYDPLLIVWCQGWARRGHTCLRLSYSCQSVLMPADGATPVFACLIPAKVS
ncbi:hypothetical protein ACOMHN_056122 [Nucella lapillus]